MPSSTDPPSRLELPIGPPAHGGHCVARHEGRVVFVRHTLPGERVLAEVTDRTSRYWRADAVQVLEPSADRVPSIWPEAGPGGVGGGELAHVALPAQRQWKRQVVLDALRRIGHLDRAHPALVGFEVQYVPLPGRGGAQATEEHEEGTGYRTRVALMADGDGRAGMHRHRSEEVLWLRQIPLAHSAIRDLDLLARAWPPRSRIQAVAPSLGPPVVLVDGEPIDGRTGRVREVVQLGEQTYRYRVSAAGFWQVHAGAPAALAGEVMRVAAPEAGQHLVDLYAGSGLFTAPLAGAIGPGGRIDAVEGSAGAARDARRNGYELPQVHLHHADVANFLHGRVASTRPDVIVLDPPRAGAGQRVMRAIGAMRPQRLVYVACDPAALARDVAMARNDGYELVSLRGFDIFPHTHHVECVALLSLAGE